MTELAKGQPTDLANPVRSEQGLMAIFNDPAVQSRIQAVVDKSLDAAMLLRMVVKATQRQPQLLECTGESIVESVVTSASLGLDCSGLLRKGYLVPFKNKHTQKKEAQFIAGYSGLVDLARADGAVTKVEAVIAYENDIYTVQRGTAPKITHTPTRSIRGKAIEVYAVATLPNGTTQFDTMTVDEINVIRDRAPAGQSGPWATDWGEMAKKTVVKRLSKLLPQSTKLQQALAGEEKMEATSVGYGEVIDVAPGQSRTAALTSQLTASAPKEPVPSAGATQTTPPAPDTPKPAPAAPPTPQAAPRASVETQASPPDAPLTEITVSELPNQPVGTYFQTKGVIKDIEAREGTKGAYLRVGVGDSQGSQWFTKWSEAPEWAISSASVWIHKAEIRLFRGKPQYIIHEWEACPF